MRAQCHPLAMVGLGMLLFKRLHRGIALGAGDIDEHIEQPAPSVLRVVTQGRRIRALAGPFDVVRDPDMPVRQDVKRLEVVRILVRGGPLSCAVPVAEQGDDELLGKGRPGFRRQARQMRF